ncbi:hypothetical protein OA067_05980 [Gammaproteobacteria bacterium]|nr:hypothetical protein [Gammaproteobacteria bacterium]
MGLRNFVGGLSASIFAFFVRDYLVGYQDKLEGYSYSFTIVFYKRFWVVRSRPDSQAGISRDRRKTVVFEAIKSDQSF